MSRYDAVVVGAGPAGLSAAAALAEVGASVLLVDESLELGGQYYRPLPPAFRQLAPWMAGTAAARAKLVEQATRRGVSVATQTAVIDIEPAWRIALHGRAEGGIRWVEAGGVVMAGGARELTMPFPGWTLPGVMTLGGAQNLFKSQGMAPGRRVVLSGTGPFLWLVAQQLIRAGVNVVAVAEATTLRTSVEFGLRAWRHPGLALEGAGHWARIGRPRFRFGHVAISVQGNERVEGVTLARVDRDWRLVPGSETMVAADALCVSHSLLPATELTQLTRCAHRLDTRTGAQIPVVGEFLETSAPRLFAAGEMLGIGGWPVALAEGRIAGLGLAARLGFSAEAELRARVASLGRTAARRRRLTERMFATYAPRPGALSWAADDTLLCRCEEVPLRDVRRAMDYGDCTADLVKSRTRCGMGRCQGRICGPVLQRLLAERLGTGLPAPSSIRQPLKPVPVRDLLRLAELPETSR